MVGPSAPVERDDLGAVRALVDDGPDASGPVFSTGVELKEDTEPPSREMMIRDPVPLATGSGFYEDFEDLDHGEDLAAAGVWTYHSVYHYGKVTADKMQPYSARSPTIGRHFNSETDPLKQGALMTPTLSISRGTIEFWAATNYVDATDHSTTVIFLFGSSAVAPDLANDRMLKIGFNYDGIFYLNNNVPQWMPVVEDADPSTWYHFQIEFDCSEQLCGIKVNDISGTQVGEAGGVVLQNGFPMLRRVAFVTGAQVAGNSMTSFWDDISIQEKASGPLETDPAGGSWYDDFHDLSNVAKVSNLSLSGNGFIVMNPVFEDFESYTDGADLIGVNGWTKHLTSNAGTFKADATRPFSAISSVVCKHYNDNPTVHSIVLSKNANIVDGVLDLWIATSYDEPTDHATTVFSPYLTTSDNPPISERMAHFGFNYHSIGFSTTGTGSGWRKVVSSYNINTWYHWVIDFKCSTQKFNVTIRDINDNFLGSITDVTFQNYLPYINRLVLLDGHQTGMQFITSYWDEITLKDNSKTYGSGYVMSQPITLPEGCRWTSLKVDKEEWVAGGSEVHIYDGATMDEIPITYDPNGHEFNISALNDLGITSLVLNASLNMVEGTQTILKGWGAEWESSNAWRDSFLTSFRTSDVLNMEVRDNGAGLDMDRTAGSIMSQPISLPPGPFVYTLHLDSPMGEGPCRQMKLIGPDMQEVGELYFIDRRTAMVTGLHFGEIGSVRLMAVFNSGLKLPVLRSWGLTWNENTLPEVLGMENPSSVKRTEEAVLLVNCTDIDHPPGTLQVSVAHKGPGASGWSADMVGPPVFNSTSLMWEFAFSPGPRSAVGQYSFDVAVQDELGGADQMVLSNAMTVLNNAPSAPLMGMGPSDPRTDSVVEARIVNESTDTEGETLAYDYTWYVNGVHVTDADLMNASPFEVAELSGNYFVKHDVVRCEVRATDGLDHSPSVSSNITINNTPPSRIIPFIQEFEVDEDEADFGGLNISRVVFDRDGDRLNYRIDGTYNITIVVHDNGSVLIIPPRNWYGKESVTFLVDDLESMIAFDIDVIVRPVNDVPALGSIDYGLKWSDRTWSRVPTQLDPDGAPLNYTENYMFEVRFDEEEMVTFKVNAVDLETETLMYTVRLDFEAPFNLIQDHLDRSVFTVMPEKDAFGEWWAHLWVDDGEENGNVTTWLLLNASNVNDDPTGFIVIPETDFVEAQTYQNITLKAFVQDPDPETLIVAWTVDGVDLVFGATASINWTYPGLYEVSCTVSDGQVKVILGSFRVNVSSPPAPPPPPPPDDNDLNPLFIIVPLAVLILIVMILVFLFFVLRRKKEEAPAKEGPAALELAPAGIAPLSQLAPPPAAAGDGRMMSLGMASSSSFSQLPPSTSPILKILEEPAGTQMPMQETLPPATAQAPPPPASTQETYIRPPAAGGQAGVQVMMAAPVGPLRPATAMMTQSGAPVPGPEPPSMQDDMMKVAAASMEQTGPSTEFHEDREHVWSPGMVESRTAMEAKNALDMLKELSDLKQSGAITEEEFEVSKKRLLRKI